MSELVVILLTVYLLVAFGVAVTLIPRDIFQYRVERFVVRVSCGLVWPMLFGFVLARWVNAFSGAERERVR